MTAVLLDRGEIRRLKNQRALTGADRFDEVWDGVYMLAPLANNQHQLMGFQLGIVFTEVVPFPDAGTVYVGVNVSDRVEGWEKNFRCPDNAVFLAGTKAKDCGTHWFGGPDFAVEIVSTNDKSRDKLEFYATIGVRELLILDRKPWRLELYRLEDGVLKLVGVSKPNLPKVLASKVLPLTFTLRPAAPRPAVHVATIDKSKKWTI